MGKNLAIAGGLVKGLGTGMVAQDEVDRKEAERLRQEALDAVKRREDRDFQRGLMAKTITDDQGQVHAVTHGGETSPLNISERPKGGKLTGPGYMAPEDKRIWDAAIERHTTKGLQGETTDWEAVASTLKQQGREDLAGMAAPADSGTKKVDVSSPEYVEAQRMADEWVSSQAGFLSGDSKDFKDHGGNREQARQAKTMEFYRQLTGGTTATRANNETKPAAGETQERKPAPNMDGSGTRDNPYKATTQAQIDWFKANAPAGTVIEVNGDKYTK